MVGSKASASNGRGRLTLADSMGPAISTPKHSSCRVVRWLVVLLASKALHLYGLLRFAHGASETAIMCLSVALRTQHCCVCSPSRTLPHDQAYSMRTFFRQMHTPQSVCKHIAQRKYANMLRCTQIVSLELCKYANLHSPVYTQPSSRRHHVS